MNTHLAQAWSATRNLAPSTQDGVLFVVLTSTGLAITLFGVALMIAETLS